MTTFGHIQRVCKRLTHDIFESGLCGVFADGLSKYLSSIGVEHKVVSSADHAVVIVGKRSFHAAHWPVGPLSQYPQEGHQFVKSDFWSAIICIAFERNLSADEMWALWCNEPTHD